METKYKLKKEVRTFFKKDVANDIENADFWEDKNIPIEILDEVDLVFVDYGQKEIGGHTSLQRWSRDGGEAHFKFTVKIIDMDNKEFNSVNIPEVMDNIQLALNAYFK